MENNILKICQLVFIVMLFSCNDSSSIHHESVSQDHVGNFMRLPSNATIIKDSMVINLIDNNLSFISCDSAWVLLADSIFYAHLSKTDSSNFPDNGTVFSPRAENVAYLHQEFYNYKRQYFAYRNSENDTFIYLNALCSNHHSDWRENYKLVMDGGRCYFQMTYNKTKKQITRFMINGES